MSSLLTRVYEKTEEQQLATVAKHPTRSHATRDKDQDMKRSPESKEVDEWCCDDDPSLSKVPKKWYPDTDSDEIMECAMDGEIDSASFQDAVVSPLPLRPGAYAVGQGQPMQYRQDDAGTTAATVDLTTCTPDDLPPIAAEVVDDTQVDISSHVRRIIAENTIQASSVRTWSGTEEYPDRISRSYENMQQKRWRKLILVLLCLIFLAVIAVVVGVTLSLDGEETQTTPITVVIQFDDHPEETGWYLHQGSTEHVAFEPGSFSEKINIRVTANLDVNVGEEYNFTIVDTGGNGIENGYYRIYDAPDDSDPDTILVEGLGDFGYQAQHVFVAVGEPECPCPEPYICDEKGDCDSPLEFCVGTNCVCHHECCSDYNCPDGEVCVKCPDGEVCRDSFYCQR